MSANATRLLSDGALVTSMALSSGEDIPEGGTISGGYVPFEKLLLPGATMEFLHADLSPDGLSEFADIATAKTYAPDPDKRYKVRTYSGSVTFPDGSLFTPSDPPGNGSTAYYARTTTDDSVTTYSLDYTTNQTGWIITETGSRVTGEQTTHATVTEAEAAAEGWTPPATTNIAAANTSLTSKEAATVYSGDGITATLSSVVIASEMVTWCQAKINALKTSVDTVGGGVYPDLSMTSFHSDSLSIRIASARMTWQGSGMFDPLPGSFSYFVSPMAPDFSLTSGTWTFAVSSVIPANERYFDAAGMYGEASWWDSSHSLFGIDAFDIVSNVTSNLLQASYPHSGISGGGWKDIHYRAVSTDGRKRKFEFRYKTSAEGSLITEELTTSAQDGFANATNYIQAFHEYGYVSVIKKIWTFDSNDQPVLEHEVPDDGYTDAHEISAFMLFKHREKSSWGYRGFTTLIPLANPTDPPREPLDVFYKTITISSSNLEYAAKDDTSPPPFLTGMTATGAMSGSYTLPKPSEWKLGTIDESGKWSRMSQAKASPFKLAWTADGKSGIYEIDVNDGRGGSYARQPPFGGIGEQRTITEMSYSVAIPMPAEADLPVRDYRKTWPRVAESTKPAPAVVTTAYTLAAPIGAFGDENYTTRQKSAWADLGLPAAGFSWISEPSDEFSAFVGE